MYWLPPVTGPENRGLCSRERCKWSFRISAMMCWVLSLRNIVLRFEFEKKYRLNRDHESNESRRES